MGGGGSYYDRDVTDVDQRTSAGYSTGGQTQTRSDGAVAKSRPLVEAAHHGAAEPALGQAEGGSGEPVMPVDGANRQGGKLIEVDARAVDVQEREGRPLARALEHASVRSLRDLLARHFPPSTDSFF